MRNRDIRRALAIGVGVAGILTATLLVRGSLAVADGPGEPKDASDDKPAESSETIDPLSVNATCYVCHIAFVREKISRVHFKEEITCIKCHGLSAAHANDEDVGATKPDIVYKRDQVDAMCGKCHEHHDIAATEVVARFVERKITESPVVCTDCHGQHRIEPPEEEEQ